MEKQLIIPASVLRQMPPMVQNELAKLSEDKQRDFLHEFDRKSKSVGNAYLCWFLLGLHYAYLGRWGIQVIFWLTAGGAFFWWFIDVFRVSGLTRDKNQDIAVEVMKNMKSIM
jgi:hypothetical protein